MRTVIAFATILFLLIGTGLAQAVQGKKSRRPEGTKGMIISVDQAAKKFTFRAGKKKDPTAEEKVVQFDDKTKFVKLDAKGTTDAQSADLAIQKPVSVVLETRDGKSIATKVTILDLPKKKKGEAQQK